MLRINNRGFKRSYVYGGTGIFDSIAKAAVSLLPVVQKGALQVGKKLGEKGVQKVSSLVSKSRDKPSKSEETKLITFRSGPKDPERSFAGPLYPERSSAGPRTRSVALQDLLQNLRTYYENTQLLHHHLRNRILT